MYDYKPPRTNATAKLAALCCFAITVIAFVGAAMVPKYPSILQCIGLCFLVPVIQITARYLILQYLYRVKDNGDGQLDFEVYAYRGGARMQLVCRVGLAEITAAAPLTAQNRKPPAGLRRYNYHPDMKPSEGFVLSITNGDGASELLLAPDARLTEIFEAWAARNNQKSLD